MQLNLLRVGLFVGAAAVLVGFAPTAASAASITCPNPTFTYGNNKTSNTYTVNPAVDCVWGALDASWHNLGNGQDAFLSGYGQNDAAYGNTGPTFGLTWTLRGDTGSAPGQGGYTPIPGLTFTSISSSSALWTLDRNNANFAGYNTFALGVKDGADPKWAVFLLDSNVLSGTVTMTGGSFSHFTVYAANLRETAVPEPASLLSLGCGLLALAHRARRSRRTA